MRNSHHFGAAGVYARIAARRGAIGMVTSATRGVTMVPTRGAAPVLGTNPLAFAAPAKRHPPFVLDMATTTTAAGKVKVHDLNDRPLPSGWVLDARGQPVTDPKQGFDIVFNQPQGGLSPLGGTLVGSSFSPIRNRTQKPGDPDDIGHFFLAIDPAAFRAPGAFENDLDDVIDVLRATPAADPARPVLVAGEPEEAERQRRLHEGIPIPATLAALIRGICDRSGAAFLLD